MDESDYISGDWLFVPFSSVEHLEIKEKSYIIVSRPIHEQFKRLDTEDSNQVWGFVIPLKYLYQTTFYDEGNFMDSLKENQGVTDKMWNARISDWIVRSFEEILKIKEMCPNSASHVNYLFDNLDWEPIVSSSVVIMKTKLCSIEPKITSIAIRHKLSPNELKLISIVIGSNKTRFSIINIKLSLNLLSDCLALLSLCANCTELELIELKYSELDCDNEVEAVNKAIRDFKSKFWMIGTIIISQSNE